MQKTQVKAGLGNLINRYREMSDLCCFVSDLPQRCGRFGALNGNGNFPRYPHHPERTCCWYLRRPILSRPSMIFAKSPGRLRLCQTSAPTVHAR
jgi:hypothetical protein